MAPVPSAMTSTLDLGSQVVVNNLAASQDVSRLVMTETAMLTGWMASAPLLSAADRMLGTSR